MCCLARAADGLLVSVKNQIDELRLQARSVKDAVSTVWWLLKKGYTIEDIRALARALGTERIFYKKLR